MAFGGTDLTILLLYLTGITAWGSWMGRANRGSTDYFLGSRNLPWWAVMFSVVATETSTLTFLSVPGISYLGTLGFLQLTLGYLAGRVVVAGVLLPAYYRGEISTAYELLGSRFGTAARRYASGAFMVTRLLADSVRLFVTAIPLAMVTGWSYPVSILVIAAVTLVYTYFGGIKAVVWVDVSQMVLYLAGGLIALLLLHGAVDGGWAAILDRAGSAGKLEVVNFDFSRSETYTFWAGLIGGGFLAMATHGTDQLIVQRLLTCRNLKHSQRALVGSGLAVIVQFALFLFVGLGLWAFYSGRAFDTSDAIFSTFILAEMPVGVRGLLVAGVFAAAMSSLSSSINSLASATTFDFWGPATGRQNDDRAMLAAGKVFSLGWAALLTVGAVTFIPFSRASAGVEVALGIASMVNGGVLGAFALGVLTRSVSQVGALAGMSAGIAVVVAVWLGSRGMEALRWTGVTSENPIAWPWLVLIGFCVTFGVGLLFRKRRG